MKKIIAACAAVVACASAQADESNWKFIAATGWADGGETIFSGYIYDINNNAKRVSIAVKPGHGLQVRVGMEYRFTDTLSVQSTIGRSVYDPMAINGSVTFTTTPIEVLANFKPTSDLMFGAGVRKTYADLQGTGVAATLPMLGSYDGDIGGVLEVKYMVPFKASGHPKGAGVGVHLRYVAENLKFQGYEVNGDHYEVGLTLRY